MSYSKLFEGSHCRIASQESADKFTPTQHNFTIINDLDHKVYLTWIDTKGSTDMSPFISVDPQESVSQMSHRGHRWLLSSEHGDDVEIFLNHGYFRQSNAAIRVSQLVKK